ncbi:MAG: winged helix-turn-helix domain-containing protein [Chlorobiales bacterium]|nr:winged helix-turn-helix domain-containing protein [Chlorobiales bacterium]
MFGQEEQEPRKERYTAQMRALDSEEAQIIESLHFMLSFADLSEETGLPGQVLKQYLARLINDGFILGMAWNEQKKDFVATDQVSCSLEACSFMATKEGLRAYYYSA